MLSSQVSYDSSLEHIRDKLKVLDYYLNSTINLFRNENLGNFNEFSGLYVADEEIDSYQNKIINKSKDTIRKQPLEEFSNDDLKKMDFAIKKREKKTLQRGKRLPLLELSKLFELSEIEEMILIALLAPEIDNKYEKIYAYLQNDVTKKNPTVQLFMDIFSSNQKERDGCRGYFLETKKLFEFKILHFEEPKNLTTFSDTQSLLSQFLLIDRDIVNFLLGIQTRDSIIDSFTKLEGQFEHSFDKSIHDEIIKKISTYLIENQKNKPFSKALKILLNGAEGIGKKTIALAISKVFEKQLLIVDLELGQKICSSLENLFVHSLRFAYLNNANLFFDHFGSLTKENESIEEKIIGKNLSCLNYFLEKNGFLFCGTENHQSQQRIWKNFFELKLDIPNLDYNSREKIWRESLIENKIQTPDEIILDLSSKFIFSTRQIHDAISEAKKIAHVKNDFRFFEASSNSKSLSNPNLAFDQCLYEGCRLQCSFGLGKFAKKISLNYRNDDIVLPPEKKKQLHDIINFLKYKKTIFSDWGFEEKLSLGKGLNILFAGESGTGKTMASEVIANELGLELYKIDLSSVVSKYIGETEKNLNKIFEEAKTSNSILFFDEADALFGKRTQVRDSHDRYANVEINYLLQKLEEHTEICILATNFAQNIDDAFARRIQFWIDFPFPDEKQRYEIWRKIFPRKKKDLLDPDIDFDLLSRQFSLTGGNIKNIALTSAFSAAADSTNISMRHIVLAVKSEYDKLGRPNTKSEFGALYKIIQNSME